MKNLNKRLHVGAITVSMEPDSKTGKIFVRKVADWLASSGWDNYITLQIEEIERLRPQRITFLKGQYQSNPSLCYPLNRNTLGNAILFTKDWIENVIA